MGLVMQRFYHAIERLSGVKQLQPPPQRPASVARRTAAYSLNLSHPFLWLSQRDYLSMRDAFEHFFITGKTGGGKTTGPMRAVLEAAMRLGWGIFACTYKSDETERIVRLARRTGREASLVVVNPDNDWRFSYLDWEMTRPGDGGRLVENAVGGLIEVIENNSPKGTRENKDAIWEEAPRRWLRHAMLAIREAGLPVTMDYIKACADGMPASDSNGGLAWPPDSLLKHCLDRAKALGGDVETVKACELYFCREMARPGVSRFAANVLVTVASMLDPFLSGPAKKLFFSETTNFTPDFWRRGAIVVLDLPVTEYGGAVGKASQLLVKHAFFSHVLRRQGLPENERPCLFYCDEYQTLMSRLDARLFEAGRSSLVACCTATQNLPAMYAALEAGRGRDIAHNMLGNMAGTWIMGQNNNHETNEYAAQTVAKALTLRRNFGSSESHGVNEGWNVGGNHSSGSSGGTSSANSGVSTGTSGGTSRTTGTNDGWREEMDYQVQPATFLNLASGGPPRYLVESIVLKAGKRFQQTGKPFMGVAWPQR